LPRSSMSQSRRVFVTGMGIISPLGLDVASTWAGLLQGESGVDYITAFDAEGFGNCTNTGACEVKCPKGISLDNIARMNREFLVATLD